MAKVRRALNIPLRFREWRWLLSEYREEDGGLPPAEDVERWKQNGPDPDDLLGGQKECSAESLSKRKVAAKSSRGEATSSYVKDGSPSRKKPRLPSAEKTQVGSAPSSSARVKHLVGADMLLGTGMVTQDTSPSVLLFFDKQRFIFNVVERWSFVALDRAVWLVFSVLLSKGARSEKRLALNPRQHRQNIEDDTWAHLRDGASGATVAEKAVSNPSSNVAISSPAHGELAPPDPESTWARQCNVQFLAAWS